MEKVATLAHLLATSLELAGTVAEARLHTQGGQQHWKAELVAVQLVKWLMYQHH